MPYRFKGFEFNSTTLVLSKSDESIAIRHIEAKLLTILLENVETVLTKEDILSLVWPDKIVSEQVVFQNISNLRALFGNEAIKTFPKRGYQWQLHVDLACELDTDQDLDVDLINSHPQRNLYSVNHSHRSNTLRLAPFLKLLTGRFTALIVTGLCIITIAIIFWFLRSSPVNKAPTDLINLGYVPFSNLNAEHELLPEQTLLQDSAPIDFTALSDVNTIQFETAMEVEYARLKHSHPFILFGKYRTFQQVHYLDFTIKGPYSDWEGQLSGQSKANVIQQLKQHLDRPIIYEILSQPLSPELKQAKLSLAHTQHQNDLIILRELSFVYFQNNEPEKAMSMTDKLINMAQSRNDRLHVGRALSYQSKILNAKQLYDLSAQKLQLSRQHFQAINDVKHLSKDWYFQAWLDDQNRDYEAIKTSLLTSATLANKAKNYIGEISVLLHLAAEGHYYQRNDEKYQYLQLAEDKMHAYQLPDYHFANASYRYASFAQTSSEKEPHLRRALNLTAMTPDNWVAHNARLQLMQIYVTQDRLNEAQSLVDSLTLDNSNNSYLKTLLARAKKQPDEMVRLALRTFEQAQMSGNQFRSLDTALLLCEQQINCDYYSQYINDNATENWRSRHPEKLAALNLITTE